MSEIENDAAEDVSYEDNEKHVVRRRANGRATRLKILAAARAIIIEKGTDSLSIDRVIKEAGVSKGSFMYHFPSRQALIEALVNEYAAHLGEVQTGLTTKAKSDCPRECQDFCVWGGYSRGSPTRLPFVFEMQYARPDAIAGAKVEGPARSAGGSSLAPAIARREAAGALAREV
ncbi:MAG: TetR/AcrR family transcriptional regulator [Holdemanella sp.]